MKEIKINTSKSYNVIVTSGNQNLLFQFDMRKINSCFIITDKNLYNLHKRYFEILKDKTIGMYIIEPGEESKNYQVILNIYEEMITCNVNKKTTVVALGGGVVGDIAGFVASTFMRGLNIVQIPTTLIAQCDSSIGGKNGFNFKNIKNIIGCIHQPSFVYADVNFLKTLNEREYINGLAEVIKYGFICDKDFFNYLESNKKGILEREVDKLIHIIFECAKIKGKIVEEDEFDKEKRHILNFGHTIGHGIESASNFKLNHGEAVALGMIIETYIALKLNLIDEKIYIRLKDIISYFNLPIKCSLNPKDIIEYAKKDKKKISNDIRFILLEGIGKYKIVDNLKYDFIYDTIKEYISKN